MGFQTNQKKSRKNIIKGGNRRRSASRRRPGAVDWLKSKLASAPEVKKAPEAPEALIGKFYDCNEYLQCLNRSKLGTTQSSAGCNIALEKTWLPEYKLQKACQQYKIYNDRGKLEAKANMRKYLETSECDDTCTTYLWQDTLNN
jgi:hypothetical protein